MATEKLCFKKYIQCLDDKNLSKTRKRMNKKSHKGRYYGGVEGDQSGADSSAVSETFLSELLNAGLPNSVALNILQQTPNESEEEQEVTGNKIDLARQLFQSLINRPDMNRQGIIDQFMSQIGVTHSTAVSYYERIAKEFGLTKKDKDDNKTQMAASSTSSTSSSTHQDRSQDSLSPDELEPEPEDDESQTESRSQNGIIRTVPNAHLIYKKQSEDGTFEELWIFNTGDEIRDELSIRRDILAGTDIPPKKTKSPDGSQSYAITTMGNAQYIHIKGLTN